MKGVQVGYWRRYYDNGQLWDAGAYEGGRKVGPWTVYDRAGALKQSTVFKLRKPKPVEPGAPAVGEAQWFLQLPRHLPHRSGCMQKRFP